MVSEIKFTPEEQFSIAPKTPEPTLQFTPEDEAAPVQFVPEEAPVQFTQEEGIWPQIKMGVKESLLPFQVTKEEELANVPHTTAEIVARTGANIATDIASSMGAGFLAGGGAPGAVVGFGLGVYRALGMEYVMSKTEDREFDPAKAAVNIAVETVPLAKTGTKLTKGLVQGGLGTVQALQYGASGETAGVVGAVQGVVAGLTHRKAAGQAGLMADVTEDPSKIETIEKWLATRDNSLKLEQKTDEWLARSADFEGQLKPLATNFKPYEELSQTDRDGLDRILGLPKVEELEATIPAKDSPELIRKSFYESEQSEFAKFIVGKRKVKAGELLTTAEEKLGQTGRTADQEWARYRRQRAQLQVLQQELPMLGPKDPANSPAFRWLVDARYAGRATDYLTGLTFERTLDDIASGNDEVLAHMTAVRAKFDDAMREVKRSRIDPSTIVDRLEAGATEGLGKFRELFDELRDFGRMHNIDIDYRENYVPHHILTPEELFVSVRQAARKFDPKDIIDPDGLKFNPKYHGADIDALEIEVDGLNRVLGKALERPLMHETDVADALRAVESTSFAKTTTGYEAMAAFARKGEVPELIREKDIGKLISNYSNNLFKTVFVGPSLRDLETMIPSLKGAGLDQLSNWWQKYFEHVSGKLPEGKAEKMVAHAQWKANILDKLSSSDPGLLARFGMQTKLTADNTLAWACSQLYPNYLGWRIGPALRNLSQPLMTLAPELRSAKGYALTMKAYVKAWRDILSGEDLSKRLGDLDPGDLIEDFSEDHLNGLLKAGLSMPRAVLRTVNNAAMWGYKASERVNRYTAMLVAEDVSELVAKGSVSMRPFLETLPSGQKYLLTQAVRSKDVTQIKNVLVPYLVYKSQFVYGKHALHQLGREYGSIVSMFSKWPSSIVSDVWEGFKYRGLGQGSNDLLWKYLLPVALLKGADMLTSDDGKIPPREKALIGNGFVSWAPISSVQISLPPAFDVLSKIGQSWGMAFRGDTERAKAQAAKVVTPFVPVGYGVTRGVQDIYSIITGEEKEQ